MSSGSSQGLKVLVAIKRVIDFAVKIRVPPINTSSSPTWVETDGVKHSMNPFDEIAVEAAIRLKEQKVVNHISVVSCGPIKAADVLKTALAMGADSAIHVDTTDKISKEGHLQPLAVARLLQAVVEKEKPDLVILGKQAIDDDSNQTGQLLAGLLNWPQATFASELKAIEGKPGLQVTREVDAGLQKISIQLPAVITTDLRLNTPRYASLQNIMKAKQKPFSKETPASLNVSDISPRLEILEVKEPSKRQAGRKVASVEELIKALKDEAQVI